MEQSRKTAVQAAIEAGTFTEIGRQPTATECLAAAPAAYADVLASRADVLDRMQREAAPAASHEPRQVTLPPGSRVLLWWRGQPALWLYARPGKGAPRIRGDARLDWDAVLRGLSRAQVLANTAASSHAVDMIRRAGRERRIYQLVLLGAAMAQCVTIGVMLWWWLTH